jgi:hypothetical protein
VGENPGVPSLDLIRWTFTIDPAKREPVEDYLSELGLDWHGRGEGQYLVNWDEPEGDPDEVIDELWALNGAPFEVTHEEFHRLNLLVYHVEDEGSEGADRAVA